MIRRAVRRALPYALRWRLRSLRRRVTDARARTRFASTRDFSETFTHLVCRYERPLTCYPGQEGVFEGKRRNCALVLQSVDRLLIKPGETFSFWRIVGRPTSRAGFLPAAALKDRRLTEDIGGSICLTSTLLYNVALLSGMRIVERRCHSVDSYGSARYFELGRDAAVEYAYLDLRFHNDLQVPLVLRCAVSAGTVTAAIWSASPIARDVEIIVAEPILDEPGVFVTRDSALASGAIVVDDPGATGVRVQTERIVVLHGSARREDLGFSVHHAIPRQERHGR